VLDLGKLLRCIFWKVEKIGDWVDCGDIAPCGLALLVYSRRRIYCTWGAVEVRAEEDEDEEKQDYHDV